MTIKWVGAALIIIGCGGFGMMISDGFKQQERLLNQMVRILRLMRSELQYHLTSLPDLCKMASEECGGALKELLQALSAALSKQDQPDAVHCMEQTLSSFEILPDRIKIHLRHLGRSIGRFDLPGQLQGLRSIENACERDLKELETNRDNRLRSYQTLSLCAGVALVILFV